MIYIVQKSILHCRICIWILIIGLTISGLTAFPLETELDHFSKHDYFFSQSLSLWFSLAHQAIKISNENYPFLSYGTDWLAFAHLMLAILFIGPLKDPVKNKWVIQFGIICCVSIIPLALIAGNIRQVPIFWQFIDCSFGIIGIIPLLICLKNIKKLETFDLNLL